MSCQISVIGGAIIDILVGPVNSSVFKTGSLAVDKTLLSFGGDALNESIALSRLGCKVGLVSNVGNDETGDKIIDKLVSENIDVSSISIHPEYDTSMNIVLVDEDAQRYFLTNPNSSLRKLNKEDIIKHVDSFASIVSFTGLFVSPSLTIQDIEDIFKEIKKDKNTVLTLDMTKAKNNETIENVECILPYIDYILPNESEIALLTGSNDVKENARSLVNKGAKCAVIKCGEKGCLIYTKENGYIEIPAYTVEKAVDTTGAGDCFVAGFLWGIQHKLSIIECGMFANALASCSIEHMGATTGITSLDEVQSRYRQIKKDCGIGL